MKESITNYVLLLSLAQKHYFEFEHVRAFGIVLAQQHRHYEDNGLESKHFEATEGIQQTVWPFD